MIVSSLVINGFRNWEDERFEFSSRGNVIFGRNGQGKTNLLEAIAFLQLGKSFRAAPDREIVKFTENSFLVKGRIHENVVITPENSLTQSSDIRVEYDKKEGKKIKFNQQSVKKLSRLMRVLNFVILSLEDRTISRGSPVSRRKFLDYSLAQTDEIYLREIQKAKQVISQKNYCLKENRPEDELLKVLNEQLAVSMKKIMSKREEFIHSVRPFFQEAYRGLNEVSEEVDIKYKPNIQMSMLEEMEDFLNSRLEKEKEFKASLYGIHRDDFELTVQGKNSRQFASQGQHKSIVIALKMSLSKYYEKYFGKRPILLLDDIFSELDNSRVSRLLELFEHFSQVFVTIPREDELSLLPNDFKVFKVFGGKLTG